MLIKKISEKNFKEACELLLPKYIEIKGPEYIKVYRLSVHYLMGGTASISYVNGNYTALYRKAFNTIDDDMIDALKYTRKYLQSIYCDVSIDSKEIDKLRFLQMCFEPIALLDENVIPYLKIETDEK